MDYLLKAVEMMYGIADLDNCYCSCEKVFRPDLEGKPIVVLSNNDGCVVARSNEAKKMGIKEGTPYFQLAQLFPGQKIAVFSSNYELYGELTGRVVSINRMHGSETIVIGAQQYTQKNGKGKAEVFANAIKHDFRSKNPTTRWSDIIKLK
jgi:hypothetical protein